MNRGSRCRRALSAVLVLALSVGGLSILAAGPASAAIVRPFTAVFNQNTTGDITLVGNTLLTCPASTACANVQSGATTTGAVINNNGNLMTYVDVDADPATFNSSSATLTVPTGATVIYAGLTWGAATTLGQMTGPPATLVGAAAPTPAAKNKVKFRAAGATGYSTLTASRLDESAPHFQGYLDVTATVSAAGSGVYTVADVQAGTGADRYAGWSLVVAYRDPTAPTRNLVVYTGYGTVTQQDPTLVINVSGFQTPASGLVSTRLGVVAYEGDRNNVGDGLSLGATPLSNTPNPVANIFNSTLTDLGAQLPGRTPSYNNQLGFDIDRFDATGVLANNATSATITVNTSATNGETYFPGVITFATDLYSPELTATKTVTDLNAGNVAANDVLEYSVNVRNDGTDSATLSTLADAIPAGTAYVPGSLTVGGAAVTDAADSDLGNVTGAGAGIAARLGTGATGTVGGTLAFNAATVVGFQVRVNASVTDGTVITNAATLAYSSAATGAPLTGGSNTVSSTVVVPPTLSFTTPLPAASVGSSYSNPFTVAGGTGPYVWSVSAGTLPAGITLDPATGLLSGTPSAAGTSVFTIRVVDANLRSASQAGSLVVDKIASTISLAASTPAVTFGTNTTLTATLPGAPSGTVTFTNTPAGGAPAALGTSTLSGGTAALTVPIAAFGLNTVTATYAGDATHTPATSSPVTVEVSGYAGQLIVSEFRTSGPAGTSDSYVELYNTGPTVPLAGIRIGSGSGVTTTLPTDAGVLGTGQSYLITGLGGSSTSLGAVSHPDLVAPIGTGGLQVLVPDTAATQTDAVGPTAGPHLGTGLAAMTGTPTAEHAWVRTEVAGTPRNTSSNAADFTLVSNTAAAVGGVLPALGSASPTGRTDAYQHNASLYSTLLDPDLSQSVAPNRVKAGTVLTVRRTITNTTGAPLTNVKVRITSLSETNGAAYPGGAAPATPADLKLSAPATPTSVVALSGGGTKTVTNLGPDAPIGAAGGGLNSTLTVPLSGGVLAAGASVDVSITFTVITGGTFWFGYDVDAL